MAKNKNSSSFGIIGFIILICIISRYSTLFKIIGGIILFLVIIYIIVKIAEPSNTHTPQNSKLNTKITSTSRQQIKRNVEILTDCLNLVNDSNNLDIVLRRYNMAIGTLEKLSIFTDDELTAMGFHLKESLPGTLKKMRDNKIQLFNQAISRNLEHDINSVVKNETKVKKIIQFRNKYENSPSLLPENKSYLDEQCNANILMYAPQNYTQINSIEHTVKSIIRSSNGTLTYHEQPDNFIKKFYELSSEIDSSRDIYEKIDACEKSYPLLKEYCRFCIENDDGELPPFINCRDIGPELYMRLGQWSDVERVIQICAEANAYYPNNDDEIWTYYGNYKRIANLAVTYIQNNPGCLQNKIYNALNVADDDREHLKHFLRCSLQIRKEKHGKTNKLYCV